MTRSIQHINWAALGANLGSALLFTLLLLSLFLWGAPLWHWLLGVAIALVLGLYCYVRREPTRNRGRTPTKPDSPLSSALHVPVAPVLTVPHGHQRWVGRRPELRPSA